MQGPSTSVEALHVAKATRLPMRSVEQVEVEAGRGIVGDRYHGTRHRHVTVQSAIALAESAAAWGRDIPAVLSVALGTAMAGQLAGHYVADNEGSFFLWIGLASVVTGVAVLALAKPIRSLMSGVR